MNWLDIVLAVILLASVLSSFRKGLSREVIGLVSVCLALLLGIWLYGSVAVYLLRYLSSRQTANFSGFAIVFCGVLLIGSILSLIVGKILRISGFSFIDHFLGLAFGLVRGILIGVALITGIMAFSSGDHPPSEVVQSRLSPYILGGARVVAAMAPHELKEGFRNSYARVQSEWAQLARGVKGLH